MSTPEDLRDPRGKMLGNTYTPLPHSIPIALHTVQKLLFFFVFVLELSCRVDNVWVKEKQTNTLSN